MKRIKPRASKKFGSPPPATVAEAFEIIGGIDNYVKWVKATPYNMTVFYTQHYPQLIPLQVTSKVDVTHNCESQTQAKLEEMMNGLIRARRHDEADAGQQVGAWPS
jgi:hypothetical protein